MRNAMKFYLRLSLILPVIMLTAFSTAAQQQTQNRQDLPADSAFVVSAKAGIVNLIEGEVVVTRDGKPQTPAKNEELKDLDRISTKYGGRIEVLLNPGSFLRLNGLSEFEMTSISGDSLALRLERGGVSIEAAADEDGTGIVLDTPSVKIKLLKSGVYRVDVPSDDTVEVLVWNGAAQVGKTKVGSGSKVFFRNGLAEETAKLDDYERDGFDNWNRSRAKELAKLNNKIKRRDLSRALVAVNNSNCGFGNWVFNRLTGSYFFLPCYFNQDNYWSSPYGYGYNNHWWQHPGGGGSGGSVGGGGGGNGGGAPVEPKIAAPLRRSLYNPESPDATPVLFGSDSGSSSGGGSKPASPPPSAPPPPPPPPSIGQPKESGRKDN